LRRWLTFHFAKEAKSDNFKALREYDRSPFVSQDLVFRIPLAAINVPALTARFESND